MCDFRRQLETAICGFGAPSAGPAMGSSVWKLSSKKFQDCHPHPIPSPWIQADFPSLRSQNFLPPLFPEINIPSKLNLPFHNKSSNP